MNPNQINRWDEIEGHPHSEWVEEVCANHTRLGYAEWAAFRASFEGEDCDPPYEVCVGNLGVLAFGTMKEAIISYGEYRRQSMDGYGRVANEPVVLLRNGDVIREHTPCTTPS